MGAGVESRTFVVCEASIYCRTSIFILFPHHMSLYTIVRYSYHLRMLGSCWDGEKEQGRALIIAKCFRATQQFNFCVYCSEKVKILLSNKTF